MKTCGVVGGVSYASTITYYQKINEIINKKLGGLHSSKIILVSLDLQEYVDFVTNNQKKFEGLAIEAVGACKNGDYLHLAKMPFSKLMA